MSLMCNSSDQFDGRSLLFTMVLDTIQKEEVARNEVAECLRLAEQLIEHAGYSGAGNVAQNDVVQMMLMSSQVGKLAERLTRHD